MLPCTNCLHQSGPRREGPSIQRCFPLESQCSIIEQHKLHIEHAMGSLLVITTPPGQRKQDSAPTTTKITTVCNSWTYSRTLRLMQVYQNSQLRPKCSQPAVIHADVKSSSFSKFERRFLDVKIIFVFTVCSIDGVGRNETVRFIGSSDVALRILVYHFRFSV